MTESDRQHMALMAGSAAMGFSGDEREEAAVLMSGVRRSPDHLDIPHPFSPDLQVSGIYMPAKNSVFMSVKIFFHFIISLFMNIL